MFQISMTLQNLFKTLARFKDFKNFQNSRAFQDYTNHVYLLRVRSDAANEEWLSLFQEFHETTKRGLKENQH